MNRSDSIASKQMGEEIADARQVRRWVQQARDGEEEAFGELMKMYHQRVFSLACGMVNNPDDARDLSQQSWVKAWKNLSRYRESSSFYTWLYRIVSNTCLDFLRHRARLGEQSLPENVDLVTQADPNPAASRRSRPDKEAERAETRRLFDAALAELSPEHRMTLTLRELEGLSYGEIAKVMDCRTGTVMSRLFYARRHMQRKLRGLL
ncbi:MAG: sigma-70 family RNA polymerase sigma factor [Kiritimatiellae bacterium]|nr:sigma-70 family RNA polymerase sigma factor [Kiritimatiellia bacterium]